MVQKTLEYHSQCFKLFFPSTRFTLHLLCSSFSIFFTDSVITNIVCGLLFLLRKKLICFSFFLSSETRKTHLAALFFVLAPSLVKNFLVEKRYSILEMVSESEEPAWNSVSRSSNLKMWPCVAPWPIALGPGWMELFRWPTPPTCNLFNSIWFLFCSSVHAFCISWLLLLLMRLAGVGERDGEFASLWVGSLWLPRCNGVDKRVRSNIIYNIGYGRENIRLAFKWFTGGMTLFFNRYQA